jgi:F-box-like
MNSDKHTAGGIFSLAAAGSSYIRGNDASLSTLLTFRLTDSVGTAMPDISVLSREPELERRCLQKIFSYLRSPIDPSNKKDLKNCSLVCKKWRDLVQPEICHWLGIIIRTPPPPGEVFPISLNIPTHNLSLVRDMHIEFSGVAFAKDRPLGGRYTTIQQCDDIKTSLERVISLLTSSRLKPQKLTFSIIPFSREVCIDDNLFLLLEQVNEVLVRLVDEVVTAHPNAALHLRLWRPAYVQQLRTLETSRGLANSIFRSAKGRIQNLMISCPVPWLVEWTRQNPQLQDITYLNTSEDEDSLKELWEAFQRCPLLRELCLEGLTSVPVAQLPLGLSSLCLNKMRDTPSLTNQILARMPNLRTLTLRLQNTKQHDLSEIDVAPCVTGDMIACPGLREIWWTSSAAPWNAVAVVSEICKHLTTLSLPQNVTDDDLAVLSLNAKRLRRLEIMDCPNLTMIGLQSLKRLQSLKYLQFRTRLVSFFSQEFFTDFIRHCVSLTEIHIVVTNPVPNGLSQEVRRMVLEILFETFTGQFDYRQLLIQRTRFDPMGIMVDVRGLRTDLFY